MLENLFWGFLGACILETMRSSGKASLPILGQIPTLLLGPPPGSGLLDRVSAVVPVGTLVP